MIDEARSTYKPFRFPWLSMGLSDAAAWYITLANAVLFRGLAPGTTSGFPEHSSNVEAMKWYTLSLRSIKSRLADPVMSVSEGLVIAVTGFLCHDVCACLFFLSSSTYTLIFGYLVLRVRAYSLQSATSTA